MRLIMQAALVLHDGWMCDENGVVLAMNQLADEVNSISTLSQHIEFAKANEAKIKALEAGEKIEFKRPSFANPKLKSGKKVETPLNDAAEAEAAQLAEEWLAKQNVDQVDKMLARFSTIAQFLERDYVLVNETDEVYDDTSRFLFDPRELTSEFVVETITSYCDPDVRKLVESVVVTR